MEAEAREVLDLLKRFERATEWTLTDARQNIQVYTNRPEISLDTRESVHDMIAHEIKRQRIKPELQHSRRVLPLLMVLGAGALT